MAGIGRTPLPVFVGGASGIIIYIVMQLTNPFLSDFKIVEGELVKYETIYNRERHNNMIYIWVNDTLSKPYVNY